MFVSFKTKFEMKKNIFYMMLMLLVSVVTFTSCDDDSSAGYTRITYYPVLSMQGDETIYLDKGATFTDPGCTAELNGEDISSQLVVRGSVDTSKSGVYNLSYSAVNADGFSASVSRTVIVTDPTDAVEGVYTTSSVTCNGSNKYDGNYEILVLNNGDGTYSVSDLLGGWYDQGRGYGSNYAMAGTISVADDGTVTMLDSHIAGWGDSLLGFDGRFDATSGFVWDAEYVSSMMFHIEMNK